jgi:hypothetical protein
MVHRVQLVTMKKFLLLFETGLHRLIKTNSQFEHNKHGAWSAVTIYVGMLCFRHVMLQLMYFFTIFVEYCFSYSTVPYYILYYYTG